MAKTAIVSTAGQLVSPGGSPEDIYGELFHHVQSSRVYEDGKKFVDMIPKRRARQLRREYKIARKDPDFNIEEFINRHFYEFDPRNGELGYVPTKRTTSRQHVTYLWSELRRRNRKNRGSLFALPREYVVPGGRFSEQFYWDTYFIMLGLAADGEWRTISGMMKNYTYMIRKFGFIPTANRTYFLSRSQPPFFSHMVELLAQHRGRTRTYAEFLPSMLAEHRFWMKGRRSLRETPDNRAYARVVKMPNGTLLNRYYDNKTTPRPESQLEDLMTAEQATTLDKDKIFLDLRAGAESGWDFSSRWFRDPQDIQTIHTTDIVPVDLNCLLYHHETMIAESYALLKQPTLAGRYRRAAEKRADAIRQFCWDEKTRFYYDYNFRTGESTGRLTLAGVFPLYAKVATAEQAAAVAERLEKEFLGEGGLVTTLEVTDQQWDSPNGWAPLQWIAIQGLRDYGYRELSDKIRDAWLKSCEQVYASDRKMIEKYNVIKPGEPGGGGEYVLQDGFGWTNGVYAVLKDETR